MAIRVSDESVNRLIDELEKLRLAALQIVATGHGGMPLESLTVNAGSSNFAAGNAVQNAVKAAGTETAQRIVAIGDQIDQQVTALWKSHRDSDATETENAAKAGK